MVKVWDAEAAKLGLASILVDTANLQSRDKTTGHDRRAVDYLEAKIMACPSLSAGYDRDEFYEAIDTAKKDIGPLKLQDILMKDYKLWDEKGRKLGISSVVRPIAFLQRKAADEAAKAESEDDDAFLEALRRYATGRELDLYAVMTTSTSSDGRLERELLVWAFNDAAASAARRFADGCRDELGLVDWTGEGSQTYNRQGDGVWRHVWWQKQVQHSRKRVAPLLREAMARERAGSL